MAKVLKSQSVSDKKPRGRLLRPDGNAGLRSRPASPPVEARKLRVGERFRFAGEDKLFKVASVDKKGMSMKPLGGGASITVGPGARIVRVDPSGLMSREVHRQILAEQVQHDQHVKESAAVLNRETSLMNRRAEIWLGGDVPDRV